MADARRWRYHPAFLTCLMMVVSVVMLLQYICNPSSGPSRPAHSVLSKLDVSIPTKNRQIPARQNHVSTFPAARNVSPQSNNITAASVAVLEDVVVVSPALEELKITDPEGVGNVVTLTNGSPESLALSEQNSVSEAVVETERLEENAKDVVVVVGAIATTSADAREEEGEQIHSLGEFSGEFAESNSASGSNGSQGGAEFAETEPFLKSSNGNFSSASSSSTSSAIQTAAPKSPDQVETESQETKEPQPMSTRSQPPKLASVVKVSKPNPIFHELQACKTALNEANRNSADPSLFKPLYKSVAAFSKSYELMEKVFKVYIYKDGRKPLVHAGPMTGIYASEGQFIERMKRATAYRTEDPSQAHMFFLPYSVQHMVTHLYVPNSRTMLPLATFIKEYVETIARKHPFWNRTQGADHFFVSCHDWGPATARDHATLRRNAMKVVCNADTTEEFVLGKDASLPEIYIHELRSSTVLGGPRHDQRPYLAFFAGQMHGRVRPVLLSLWKDKDPDLKIYEVLPKHISRAVSYSQHMKLSKYCICAAGYEVNSPRIVEAIYHDCVPVIIADHFVLPFSDVLDWEAFSVTIPERDMPRLKSILMAIPDTTYKSMQWRLRKVRKHFVWHDVPEKYDAFHMILHSVWSSRLNRLEQIRASASGESF